MSVFTIMGVAWFFRILQLRSWVPNHFSIPSHPVLWTVQNLSPKLHGCKYHTTKPPLFGFWKPIQWKQSSIKYRGTIRNNLVAKNQIKWNHSSAKTSYLALSAFPLRHNRPLISIANYFAREIGRPETCEFVSKFFGMLTIVHLAHRILVSKFPHNHSHGDWALLWSFVAPL